MRFSAVSTLLVSASLAACDSTVAPVCADTAPQPRITSREHSIALGTTYSANVESVICAGSRTAPFDEVWRSANAAVATVDSSTGLIRAVGRGTTYVYALHKFSGISGGDGQHDSLKVVVP